MEDPEQNIRRDMVVGASLFVLSVLWTALVYFTVPTTSYGVRPRVFPIVLGLFLMGLSLVLLGASLYNLRRDGERHPAAGKNADRLETKSARTDFSLQMRVLLGMGIGITLGCWLVFGEVLGAYIPRGTWVSLF